MPNEHSDRVLYCDPDYVEGGKEMEFRLTYEGYLLGASRENTRAKHKHEIRKRFHPQLKRLWEITPQLKTAKDFAKQAPFPAALIGPDSTVWPPPYRRELLAKRFSMFGYNFVPLVTADLSLTCAIEILFLRPDIPGCVLTSGDIDNRLKTLFDALRIPHDGQEIQGYETPGEGEVPFFCLLQDDSLISKISVETDTLLEPIKNGSESGRNDARLVITVRLHPYVPSYDNFALG